MGIAVDTAFERETRILPTRRGFMGRVAEVLESNPAQSCILMVIGLDRLTLITESFGHQMTQALLDRAEGRIHSVLRTASAVARLGENEFGALLTVFHDKPMRLGAQIVDVLSRPYLLDGQPLIVGCSVGIAAAPSDEFGAEALAHRATLALAQARRDGGGQCVCFDPVMAVRASARANLDFELRRALCLREFELHYQPQIDLVTGRIRGFESLLRWRHPTRGLLSPSAFLSVAEETGLLLPIGEWVIQTAAQEAVSWASEATIGVNIDAALFQSGRLGAVVENALATSGLSASRLDIEVTEGVLLRGEQGAVATLMRLRDIGVRVSMDDFGTGFSSLNQLRQFPFSKIKIDRSLVTGIADDPNGAVFVRAIAMMGAGLGMDTVAEGVETQAELESVRAEGCTYVQGFLTGRPVPAEQAVRLASESPGELANDLGS